MTPALASDSPILVVHASGRFSARSKSPQGARYSGKLTARELQLLLQEIIDRHRFQDVNVAAIEQKMREVEQRGGRIWAIKDGGETVIQLRLPEFQHSVAIYGLQAAHSLYPEILPLQNLYAIQQRLLAIAQSAP
jgi:hypothetical protein